MASFRKTPDSVDNKEIFVSNGSDLYLGPDFLKDQYTLLNCPLLDSPHCGFVECLSKGGNPRKTDYIKRYYKGTLDARFGHARICDFSVFFEKNSKREEEIMTGKIEPIRVYEWKGKKYIKDGKHRAALCVLLHKDIPCIVDSGSPLGGISECQLRIAKKNVEKYSKHIQFFEQ